MHPTTSGAVLFARYAYPPNELGYCGPDDPETLLDHGAGLTDDPEILRRARAFEGAWPYLEVIAAAAGVDDPLDARVVEAYWVGNHLLEAVDRTQLIDTLLTRFRGQVGGSWRRWADTAGAVAPHHSFQVLEVYPWIGLLGKGNPAALAVLDKCRIRWGEVVDVCDEHATVRSQPLLLDRGTLRLGPSQHGRVRWAHKERALAPALNQGLWVSLHWDWVCDVLSPEQLETLRDYTDRQLRASNAWLAGG